MGVSASATTLPNQHNVSARERKYLDNLQELRAAVSALKSTTDKLNGALDTIDTEDSLAEQMVKKLESIMGE